MAIAKPLGQLPPPLIEQLKVGAGSSCRWGRLHHSAPHGRRKNRPWQDDNARRRPRALCALYAFTKLEAGNGPVFEGAGLEGSHRWLEPCGNARLERQ